MDQQRALHSGGLVSGIRTPPVRRNSKLASLGRIFKPWKWRKKKSEKPRPPGVAEKKAAVRQKRDELVKRSPGEMETESDLACGGNGEDPDTPAQSDGEDRDEELMAPLASASEDLGSDSEAPAVQDVEEDPKVAGESSQGEDEDTEDGNVSLSNSSEERTMETAEAAEAKQEMVAAKPQRRASTPPPPSLPVKLLTRLGSLDGAPPVPVKKSPATLPRNFTLPKEPHGSLLRGRISTPTGSPHLGALHQPLPPSCIIEELHRALATKHRQESFQTKEARCSPKRRADGRLSRTSSMERESLGEMDGKKRSDENKENCRLDQYTNDQDSWNESVISGTLPRRMRKELLAVKLRNRPSKQELEDRNIFPVRSDQERQEIRQQIEMKLAKRLSQRPAVEELESRNILKQRNDQIEQEERREIKQRLNRKLNQRPTVDELRDRKILIRFSDYVEVAKAQDYDRRADKPWTRLSAADKAAIRKELNEFKSNEMEVHSSSKHLTRFHRP
ncbi:phosphatase and actin regulator 3b isoform X2 [Poecilia formosa]|uniref:Phosphatase and actin regulator n=2 Tax=Poecilia formosa TaxID=48698 RepID=A0A087X7Q2_POEFO|nr:PREDICTED: phosphatase and actin regulator 3 isoform X2 [Poecilia formosa]XP_016531249.1 PREDICTED: phosphatase and actin regulator 3 isoform X2 [Poecilia formosa]XP_016531250.1 PREDICTED: phosphatase and actin regulator 3 isoform X2 [Poecilia formosa]